ncbi:hypothetical protein APHAL10511_006653 [Amanita phalloides]|nr:hypothetical protein APHAL10511_006653 [Amanita phalloides]
MPKPYEGHCLCGGCKIVVDAEPMLNGLSLCHCQDCRHCSGGAFTPVVLVSTENLGVEGSVKEYSFVNPSSGNTVSRWFCTGCGSHLFSRLSTHPERTAVKAGNIEAFTKLPVILEVFTKDRWPSIPPIQGAMQCEGREINWRELVK